MAKKIVFVLFGLTLVLGGCSGVDIATYRGTSPEFDLFTYFQGETRGWGIVRDWKGEVTRSFSVTVSGKAGEGDSIVLTEDLSWSDGEQSLRTWEIERTGENSYTGRDGDVVGSAQGLSAGNALNWQYTLNLVIDDGSWKIHFDDWMYLQPDGILLNTAEMSKFGIQVGEVVIAFSKNFPEEVN